MEEFLEAVANYGRTLPVEEKPKVYNKYISSNIDLDHVKGLREAVLKFWEGRHKYSHPVVELREIPLYLTFVKFSNMEIAEDIRSCSYTMLYAFNTGNGRMSFHPAILWEICELNKIPYPKVEIEAFVAKQLEIPILTFSPNEIKILRKLADETVFLEVFKADNSPEDRRFWRVIWAVILYELKIRSS